MNPEDRDRDPVLQRALRAWQPPLPSPELDRRVLASYRTHLLTEPLWRRGLRGRVALPVPVFALVCLLAIAAWLSRPAVRNAVPARPVVRLVDTSGEVQSVVVATPQGASYITSVDLAGFRPVRNAKIVISRKGSKP